ncbi:MAG: protein kinase [Myxococcales bacterium]|nr:protein kinase [Myxococcales bacterium]
MLSGRYRLIEIIGRGGMGAVYRAHHILMDKPVAVKVLRQELASDTEAVARFHREARSASRLDHEHIIRVSDFGQTDDGLLFLIMELLDGENLAEVVRRGPLPWRRAAGIARDVALGLSHAHEQGVIHRDLKPENIVLVRRGKSRQLVKVLDFGLAKLISHTARGDADGEPDVAVQSLTRTGVVFGTPEYMSPEQAEGRPLDPRTDLYALGVVLYQMLSGALPFTASTFLALIAKTVNEPPPPLRSHAASLSVPADLESLVLRCLAKDPEDRPESAEHIAESLEQLLSAFPDENLRSGEISIARSGDPAASSSPSSAPAVAPVPGGVARTVPRLPAPRGSSRDAISAGAAAKSENAAAGSATHSGPTSLSAAFAAAVPASARTPKRSAPLAMAAAPAALDTQEPPANEAGEGLPRSEPLRSESAHSEPARSLPPRAEEARSEQLVSSRSLADFEADLAVPRRFPWWTLLVAVVLIGGLGLAMRGDLQRRLANRPDPLRSDDPLVRARALLQQRPLQPMQVDEALRILRQQRQQSNSAELQRLLSLAYETQDNRLRALGHLYAARNVATSPDEIAQSELALAQLLSRLGHSKEACQTASKLLASKPTVDVTRSAQALIQTEHCP